MSVTIESKRRILGERVPDGIAAEAQRLHTMLEVAFLAAAADGKLADDEIRNLTANLQAWLHADLDQDFYVSTFGELADLLAEQGFAARLAHAAAQLDAESRRTAYILACVTVLCDLEVHDDELLVLGKIADAFEIPEAEAQATFDEIEDTVDALVSA
ncbi:MAG: tellurite resistance TerB family protein [Deltaproteobacteria bacterium]|nr:tellurite resistance TerB family protein [Kofleriaceae bacterium]